MLSAFDLKSPNPKSTQCSTQAYLCLSPALSPLPLPLLPGMQISNERDDWRVEERDV